MSTQPRPFAVGDRVVLAQSMTGSVNRVYRVRPVERVTSTQVVVDGIRFRADNGRAIGSSSADIEHYDPAAHDERLAVSRRMTRTRRVAVTCDEVATRIRKGGFDPRHGSFSDKLTDADLDAIQAALGVISGIVAKLGDADLNR